MSLALNLEKFSVKFSKVYGKVFQYFWEGVLLLCVLDVYIYC